MASIILVIVSLCTREAASVYLMMGVSFFMSIMYPTIFGLSIQDLGADTKMAASFMVMAIIGGALFPPLMGYIADGTGLIHLSFLLPLFSFFFILYYATRGFRLKHQG